MSCLHGLYKGAFHRNHSSSCDNLSLRHAVKIRSKLCPLAKYGILASSSHCGECMTNNLFIIKATFPCLGISANMLLQALSAHLEHSFIDFDCWDEPWINTTAITTCTYIFSEKKPTFFLNLLQYITAFCHFTGIPFMSVVWNLITLNYCLFLLLTTVTDF